MTPEEWNRQHPIGTRVRVTLLQANDGRPQQTFDTVTRSECWALGDGTPVVLVVGRTGGYSVKPGWMQPLQQLGLAHLPVGPAVRVHNQQQGGSVVVATWQLYRQRESAAFRKYGGVLQTLCVLGFDSADRVICVGHGCAGKKRRMSLQSLLSRYEYFGEATP